jgi:hypothetical protein
MRAETAVAAKPANTLRADERLDVDDSLVSANGRFELVLQQDGNLVLHERATGRVLWETHTSGHEAAHAIMQADGDFVLYDVDGHPIWDSETREPAWLPAPRLWLKLLDNGTIAICRVSVVFAGGGYNDPGVVEFVVPEQLLLPGESPSVE